MTTGKLVIDTKEKTCNLSLNFFIDDFESELRKMYPQPPFNYVTPNELMKATIEDYIGDHFGLMIENIVVPLKLKTIKKIEENVCQVTFSGKIDDLNSFDVVTIKDVLLFSSFKKQSNILHLVIDNQPARILKFYHGAPVRNERF